MTESRRKECNSLEQADDIRSSICEAELTFLIGDTKPTAARHGTSVGFFNPRMGGGRDLSTLLLRALLAGHGGQLPGGGDCESNTSVERSAVFDCLDPFCGVGSLPLRWAAGVGGSSSLGRRLRITATDASIECIALAQKNAAASGHADMGIFCADAKLFLREAALLAHSETSDRKGAFDYVHLDPFGCVVPYLELALDALPHRGVLGVTATDAAALNGVEPLVARRHYGVALSRGPDVREQGLRMLLGAVAAAAARLDKGVEVLLAAHPPGAHYALAACRVLRGARRADASAAAVVGGLWTGPLGSARLLVAMAADAASGKPALAEPKTRALVARLAEEAGVDAPGLPRRAFGVRVDAVVAALRADGWTASRTHFDPRSVKTPADDAGWARALARAKQDAQASGGGSPEARSAVQSS